MIIIIFCFFNSKLNEDFNLYLFIVSCKLTFRTLDIKVFFFCFSSIQHWFLSLNNVYVIFFISATPQYT